MKMINNKLAAAVTAAGIAMFGMSGNANAAPNTVPFKASVVTQETLRGSAACPSYLSGSTTGTGNASHLGAIAFLATDCVTPGPSAFVFSNGNLTLFAPNGDTLFGRYDGMLTPNAQPNSLSTISGQFRVTGGTGRFTGASGSGYIQGTENLSTGQGQFDLNGTISY